MRNLNTIFLALTLLVFAPDMIFAQQTGTIEGEITEAGTGEPLYGANAIIIGTSKGAAADINGRFTIRNVEPGTHMIKVSYLGYRTIEQEVEATAGETIEVSFILEWAGVEGQEVNISAQAQGQIRAINEQLASNTISNIVSSDRIREFPDVNAAESVGRLPGVSIQRSGGEARKVSIRGLSPKYNTVTINGVRVPSIDNDRSVDLSLISSSMLDGIEVKKANTPDMDADALGGSIDLKLREAPEDFTFNIAGQGGYNQLQDYFGNYKFDASLSNRFIDDKLGLILGANADEYNRSADKFSAGYRASRDSETNERFTIPSTVQLNEENVTRGRIGGSAFIDYKIPEGKITANAIYSESYNEGVYRTNDMNLGNNRHYYQVDIREGTNSIFTGALGFEREFADLFTFNASVSRTNSQSKNPEDLSWQFAQESSAFSNNTFTGDNVPSDIIEAATVDSSTALAEYNVYATDREENTTSTEFNFEVPFDLDNGVKGFLKAGGKFKWLDRYNDQTQAGRQGLQYPGTRSDMKCVSDNLPEGWNLDEILASQSSENLPIYEVMLNYERDDFLDGDYDLGFVTDEQLLREITSAAIGCGFPLHRENSIGSIGDDYDGIERYQAGYVMAEFTLGGKVKIIPGVRYEADYSRYNGIRFIEVVAGNQQGPPSDLTELQTIRENQFWLPMIHLQYDPFDWLKIRLARTETITRPDYRQYAPITRMNSQRNSYQAANSELRPAHSTNYDLSVALYENRLGFFTVSGFYKNIDDLIIWNEFSLSPDLLALDIDLPGEPNIPTTWYDNETINWGGYNINNPYETEYVGVEFDWQTNLWYLPSFLKGLVLNLNYTLIHSETTYQSFVFEDSDSVRTSRPLTYWKQPVDSLRTARMPDQPRHIANVTVGYDYKGFSARVSGIYQSDITTGINTTNPVLDSFTGDYFRIDVSARQKLIEGLEVFLNLNNLNSRPDRSYQSAPNATNRPTYIEYYGFTTDLGIRYSF
ncbi:MAG: TonB-dependent receptor [Balneolaceae bacterium]